MNNFKEKLQGKAVLITGASKGIGRAIAESLGVYKMKIGLLARSGKLLSDVAQKLEGLGSEVLILETDLKERKYIEEAASRFNKKFGVPDFLINNAGIGVRGFWQDISLDAELDEVAINYIAPITLIRLLLPDMLRLGRGHIININAIGGMYAAPYQGAYGASKTALLAYSTSLAYELKKTKVKISSLILPGPIDTDFLNKPNFEGFKSSKDLVPAQEIAKSILSLIEKPREAVFVGPRIKLFAVKIVSFKPESFRKIIEKKNPPPYKLAGKG